MLDVLIRCSDKRLPVILQACDGAMELISVKISTDDLPVKTRQAKRTFGYVNGKHNKGSDTPAMMRRTGTPCPGQHQHR